MFFIGHLTVYELIHGCQLSPGLPVLLGKDNLGAMHTAKLSIAQEELRKKRVPSGIVLLWPWYNNPWRRVLFKTNITGDGCFMKEDPAGIKDDFNLTVTLKV